MTESEVQAVEEASPDGLPVPSGDPPEEEYELSGTDYCDTYAIPPGAEYALMHDYEIVYYYYEGDPEIKAEYIGLDTLRLPIQCLACKWASEIVEDDENAKYWDLEEY